jgi:hypothetical protein
MHYPGLREVLSTHSPQGPNEESRRSRLGESAAPSPGEQSLERVGPTTPTRVGDTGIKSPERAWSDRKRAVIPWAIPGKQTRRSRSSRSNSPSQARRPTLSAMFSSGLAGRTTPTRPRRSSSFSAWTSSGLVGMVPLAEPEATDRRLPGPISTKTDRTPTLKSCKRSTRGLL